MKKVLLFIDWFLPGTNAGGPVSSYSNLVDHFSKEIHFFVITRDTDYCSTDVYEGVQSNKWNQIRDNLSVYYISDTELSFKKIKEVAFSTIVDLYLINGIYSTYFSIYPLKLLHNHNKPVIVSARGMLNPQAFSTGSFKKKAFLRALKLLGYYKNVTLHATNEIEKSNITKQLGDVQIKIASNLPKKLISNGPRVIEKVVNQVKICSFARVSPEKGTLNLLKSVTKVSPDYKVDLDLYGSVYDQEYWKECEKIIRSAPNHISIRYKGAISGSLVSKVLTEYHIMCSLTEGENFGHSILESLSVGLPVLISDQTPWNGLAQEGVGWDLSLVKGVDVFTDKIEMYASMGQDEMDLMSNNAFDYAVSFCENPKLLDENRKLFYLV